jgi:CRISPR-associated endoribonuclease Cas6
MPVNERMLCFMQLHATFSLKQPLVLPISHHHILQSAVYGLMKNLPSFTLALHDSKLPNPFCFSNLYGPKKIMDRRIFFHDDLSFQIRSIYPEIILSMEETMRQNGLLLGDRRLLPQTTKLTQPLLEESEVRILMRSPITIHTTDEVGKSKYFNPFQEDFEPRIRQNFVRKYLAATGKQPVGELHITPLQVSEQDKCITFYHRKNLVRPIVIEAWYGIYELNGIPEHLNFLYYSGLGARNGAGFGLFDVLEDDVNTP